MVLLLWRPIVMSDIRVVPEWHFCQTIVQFDITIVQYDITIVTPWCWTICYNIVWSICFFARNMLWLQMVMRLGIDQWAWTMNIWHIIKLDVAEGSHSSFGLMWSFHDIQLRGSCLTDKHTNLVWLYYWLSTVPIQLYSKILTTHHRGIIIHRALQGQLYRLTHAKSPLGDYGWEWPWSTCQFAQFEIGFLDPPGVTMCIYLGYKSTWISCCAIKF